MENNKIVSTLLGAVRHRVLPVLLALPAAGIAWYQLELSDGTPASFLAGQIPVYALLNAATALCLVLILYGLLQKWSRATGVGGALLTVLAIANYYTRDLHGAALMPQDVLNIGTAAEVMGSYTLRITTTVVGIVALYVPVLFCAFLQAMLLRDDKKRHQGMPERFLRLGASIAAVAAILYLGYLGPNPVKPRQTYGWAWQNTYYTYGYLAGTVESTLLLQNPIVMPENYSEEAAKAALDKLPPATPESATPESAATPETATGETAATAETAKPATATPTPNPVAAKAAAVEKAAASLPGAVATQQYPDIVMILSESFYDPSLVTDLQVDVPYRTVTQSLPNAILGHTVSPHVGGGTNSSEYEMLTSNSLMLMPSITPFNWLNLNGADSMVSYLESLGYSTMAAHPFTNANYRRDTAWRALGFDETHFEADFPTKDTYGNRPYQTDSATYKDLEALYEAMPEDAPRFTFLVSIQSHGDYDRNDASQLLVHAGTDYGEYDAMVDEYLSCMYLSDAAVQELTDYFTAQYAATGRKVIVAMAGDHAPSFIDHIADQTTAPANDLQILERSTPYFIWANYPLAEAGQANPQDPLNRMDMCDLAPTVAQVAGLPLTDYYRYLLAMKQVVPVQTAGNDFMLADGTTARYGENAENDGWVNGYFALEYNNIGTKAKKLDTVFSLPPTK